MTNGFFEEFFESLILLMGLKPMGFFFASFGPSD